MKWFRKIACAARLGAWPYLGGVTPRIIVQGEEEEKLGIPLP